MKTFRQTNDGAGQKGQTLLEFTVSAAMLALVISGSGWLLRVEWERSRCAFLVFEKTHARLTGTNPPRTQVRIIIREKPDSVEGEGKCGNSIEHVEFDRLEKMDPSWFR